MASITQCLYTHDAIAIKKENEAAVLDRGRIESDLPGGDARSIYRVLQNMLNVNPSPQENSGKIQQEGTGGRDERTDGCLMMHFIAEGEKHE